MDIIASTSFLCPMATIMTDSENRTFNDKFMLRLPDGMRERIRAAAAENGRSMNAEIVFRLEATLAYEAMDDWADNRKLRAEADLNEKISEATALDRITDKMVDRISERIIEQVLSAKSKE